MKLHAASKGAVSLTELVDTLLAYQVLTQDSGGRPRVRHVSFADEDDRGEEGQRVRQVRNQPTQGEVAHPSSHRSSHGGLSSQCSNSDVAQLASSVGEMKEVLWGMLELFRAGRTSSDGKPISLPVAKEHGEPRCYRCQNTGHFQRECPTRSRSPSPGPRPTSPRSPRPRRSPSPSGFRKALN